MPHRMHLDAITRFPILLLDMNSTFMFGEDRFGSEHDYAVTYASLGGTLPGRVVQAAIQACYNHLAALYPQACYYEAFPSVRDVLSQLPEANALEPHDQRLLERTFARHELGHIPDDYAEAVRQLARRHRLGLVADVWSAKELWLDTLDRARILDVFEVLVFSSDHGYVKPSPRPFQRAMEQMNAPSEDCLVVGDSARRDVGGANAAGLAALWIGNGTIPAGATWAIADLRDLTQRP